MFKSMSLEEWIGSIISLLGLAALFFFNQRPDNQKAERTRQPAVEEDDEEDDPWKEFLRITAGEPKPKKKKPPAPPVKQVAQIKSERKPKPYKPTSTPYVYEESHEEVYKPVLHSSRITRLKSVPLFYGEVMERQPRIKKVLKDLPSLKTMIICREIIEKPKF